MFRPCDGHNPTYTAFVFFAGERPLEYLGLGCSLQVAAAWLPLMFCHVCRLVSDCPCNVLLVLEAVRIAGGCTVWYS